MQDGVFKQITIKRNYPTTGYSGTNSEQIFFQGYAKVQIGSGREYFAALQRHSDLQVLAELTQYVRGVDETMNVYIDGLKYGIINQPIGTPENNHLELKLKRVK